MHSLLPVIVVVVIVVLALIAVIISQSLLNERLKKEIKSEEDSHARSRKEHSEKVKSLSETIVQVMDTNKQLNDCNDEIITLMEQHTPAMEGLIKDNANLLAAQERLVECIRKTGIRDNKGVTRKAIKEQIDCLLLGFEIVSEPSKPTRDWSAPQAFPRKYIIPKGIEIISISDNTGFPFYATGKKGVISYSSDLPLCLFEGKKEKSMCSEELAPINPTDHPEHPQFKG